ncbi:MAG: copper homeostasis protein CutC [Candidatus Nanopelagicales bacterium]
MIRELCLENAAGVAAGIAAGADRLELCDNLAVGGTTVSLGVAEYVCEVAGRAGVPVMAMVRPRGGDFVHDAYELRIMVRDIGHLRGAGVAGVVFGTITAGGELDRDAAETLLAATAGLSVTFHMAFDELPSTAQLAAIDWLAERGVARILTHGGPLSLPPQAVIGRWRGLIAAAGERIIILPGGGITRENAESIAAATGARELHGTKIV